MRRSLKILFASTIIGKGSEMKKGSITNQIRTLRFHNEEMTQEELAMQVGVTRQTIIALEKDKYSPSLELAFRISTVFRVPLEEVFSYELKD